MKGILKFVVGFTIGQLMGVMYRVELLGLFPSMLLAVVGTVMACFLIDKGFKKDELNDNNSGTDLSEKQ